MRLVEQVAQPGVAQGQPAARRDAVGLVVELVRPQLVEVVEQPLLEQLGVQFRHAVDREAADDGQIGHADLGLVTLLDERHAALAVDVAGPAAGDLGQEAGVDLVDDLQQARQELAEQAHRPALQRLRAAGCGWCRPWSGG